MEAPVLLNGNDGHQFRDGELDSSGGGPGLIAPAAVLVAATLGALLHPHPLVLGVLAAILVVGGFMIAGAAYLTQRRRTSADRDGYLLPGLMIFGGFVAAALCDADRAVQSLGFLAH